MKIASITITSDRSQIIGDALRSVLGQVDAMVFVDLGIDKATADVILEVGDGLERISTFQNPSADTATWRNAGLQTAAEIGADYAIQLDTDERMIFPPDFRQQLERNPEIETFSSLHVHGGYSKERVFKIPSKGHFKGNIHEAWIGEASCLMQGLFFDELPKSEERLKANTKNLIDGLIAQRKKDPLCHRWPFQLGLCYRAQDEPNVAIGWFMGALDLEAAPEQKAIGCYQIALCHMDKEDHPGALYWCCQGLQHHPGLAELSHLAGVCCLKLGRLQEALCWANMAISNGLFVGSSFAKTRAGLREPYSLWEGPFEMQKDILKAMQAPEETIQETMSLYKEAKSRRLNYARQ